MARRIEFFDDHSGALIENQQHFIVDSSGEVFFIHPEDGTASVTHGISWRAVNED